MQKRGHWYGNTRVEQMIDIGKMSVLIVDDALSMCRSIQKMLKVIGYGEKYEFAIDGKDALNILQNSRFDLVLLDYNMPVMTGGELLSRIREDRKLKDIPVIMVTGQTYRDYVAEAAESEIDAYILKPLTIKLLEEKISYVIDKVNNPEPMYQHLKNAAICDERGDIDGAIAEAERARAENLKSSRPVRELGYYYFKKNDVKKAEKLFLEAVELNNLDVFAFHHLGSIYLKQNDIEKALYYLDKAMKISPRHVSRGIDFGKTLTYKNRVSEAEKVFDQALKFSGYDPILVEEVVDFCIDHGVYEYAAELLEATIKSKTKRWDLIVKLGKVYEQLGNLEKAVHYFTKADGLDKENIDIKLHIGRNYLAMGKPMWAEMALKEILDINENHSEAEKLLKMCL
jgi:CheY-like chemotaxis protein